MSNSNQNTNEQMVSGVRAVNALLSGFRNNQDGDSDVDSRDNSRSDRFEPIGSFHREYVDQYVIEDTAVHQQSYVVSPRNNYDAITTSTSTRYVEPASVLISGSGNNIGISSSGVFQSGGGHLEATSRVSEQILNARQPIAVNESAMTTVRVNGQDIQGIWVNKDECLNWRGPIPLDHYAINSDAATVIRKQTAHSYDQVQNISVRYLKPPPLPSPGDLIIRHEADVQLPPAPPIIIRQQAAAVKAPPTLIYREKPPRAPAPVPTQTITIPGRTIEPPPRQVIVERMAAAAPPPQDVIIERWLAYPRQKRQVVHQKAASVVKALPAPKNVLIDWESHDQTQIRQQYHFLGVENENPVEYERRHGHELVETNRLPAFVNELNTKIPQGEVLAANVSQLEFVLSGDLDALKLVEKSNPNVNLKDYFIQRF